MAVSVTKAPMLNPTDPVSDDDDQYTRVLNT